MVQRFQYPQNGLLRTELSSDGRLLICLHDVCNILDLQALGLTTTQVMNKLNPRERIKRKLDTGSLAWFISYPELMSIPDRIKRVNRYELRKLSNFIKNEVIPSIEFSDVKDLIIEDRLNKNNYDTFDRPVQNLPKTYTEALRELADTTERLEAMKVELQEMKQTAGYVRELTTLVERTLLLNGIRI